MKRFVSMVMVLAFCVGVLSGCGDTAPETADKEVSLDQVIAQIEAVNPVKDERELDDFAVENELCLTMEFMEDYKGKITNAQEDCALIFVAKASSGQAKALKGELEAYQDSLAGNDLYVEYADKIRQAKNAVVAIYGDYVVMVVAGIGVDYADVRSAMEEAFE